MGIEVKIMKAIFVIAIVLACLVCNITTLECYGCSFYNEDAPNCDSPIRRRCSEEIKFCGKMEYTWFFSLFVSEPPGHFVLKMGIIGIKVPGSLVAKVTIAIRQSFELKYCT